MDKRKEELLVRRNELERRSIVMEKLTIGGIYHLLNELKEVNMQLDVLLDKGCGKSYNNNYGIPKWCGEEGLCEKCLSQSKSAPKGCGTEIGNSGTVNCGDTEELTGSQHLCKDCLLKSKGEKE